MRRTTQQNGVTTPPGVRCKEGAAPANSIKTVRYWSAGDFQPHLTNGQVTPKKRNRDAFAVADSTRNRVSRRHCCHREGAEVLQKSTMAKTVSEGHYPVKRGNMRFRALFMGTTPKAARTARGGKFARAKKGAPPDRPARRASTGRKSGGRCSRTRARPLPAPARVPRPRRGP